MLTPRAWLVRQSGRIICACTKAPENGYVAHGEAISPLYELTERDLQVIRDGRAARRKDWLDCALIAAMGMIIGTAIGIWFANSANMVTIPRYFSLMGG